MKRRPGRPTAAAQRGAAAVEFALVFLLLFTIFYAIVQYGFALLLQQSLVQAVEEGARAAVQNAPNDAAREARAKAMVIGALGWLPDAAALAPQIGFAACPGNALARCVTVTLAHDALVPAMNVPGLSAMPGRLSATAVVQI